MNNKSCVVKVIPSKEHEINSPITIQRENFKCAICVEIMKILAVLLVCVVEVWTFECGGLHVTECIDGEECCVVSITSDFSCAPYSQKGDYCLSNSTEYTRPYQFYCPCEKSYQCLFRGDYFYCT